MGRLLSPVVGDGEGGDSTGLSGPRRRRGELVTYGGYRTLPTAMVGARSSRIDTHSPESVSDCRFRYR